MYIFSPEQVNNAWRVERQCQLKIAQLKLHIIRSIFCRHEWETHTLLHECVVQVALHTYTYINYIWTQIKIQKRASIVCKRRLKISRLALLTYISAFI